MQLCLAVFALLMLLGGAWHPDDEGAAKTREAALQNWRELYKDVEPVVDESAHFLVLRSPDSLRTQKKPDAASLFEAAYESARKTLQIETAEESWQGKLTIYLVPDRMAFNSLVRSAVKQRPSPDDCGAFSLKSAHPIVVATTPKAKYDPEMEAQAAEQVVAAVLAQRAGDDVAPWLAAGFARAVVWRAAKGPTSQDRMVIKRLARGRTARDVWDGRLPAEEAAYLRASLAEFLAFGPQSANFPKFIDALKPETVGRNRRAKSVDEALQVLPSDANRVHAAWLAWIAKNR
jgi:hypothetical protein